MREADILADILRTLGARTDCRLLRLNVGLARDPRSGRAVRFGVPGQGDVLCLVAGGRYVWIEVKSPSGRQSEEQENFERMVLLLGGRYVVARSVQDAITAVEAALAG